MELLRSLHPFLLKKQDPQPISVESSENSPKLVGIRNDFAAIGGSFKTGLSFLSTHKAVNEISRLPLGFLLSEDDEEVNLDDGSVGITEEVLEFANNISMHSETWLEFPLLVMDENFDSKSFTFYFVKMWVCVFFVIIKILLLRLITFFVIIKILFLINNLLVGSCSLIICGCF